MDTAILFFIQQHFHNSFTDFLFPIFTALGEDGLIWICIALLLCLKKASRRFGIMMLCSLAVTFLLGEVIIKNIVQRPRPFIAHPEVRLLIPPPSGFSFPSGHSASSFSAATTLWFYNHRLGCGGILLASCIAFSRLFLFVHYPSDVLAGAILGIFCSTISYLFVFNNSKMNNAYSNLHKP